MLKFFNNNKELFKILDKQILKNKYKYYLLKLAPKGYEVSIQLTNNLKYKLRGRSTDKTILKEVWLINLYNQFGVKVEEGDTVVDIGAHVGIFSTYASELSKTGKVYSFEPFIDNYNRLKLHKSLNNKSNIITTNCGIDGDTGKKVLYVHSKNSGANSLLKGKDIKKEIEIETIKLSDFCEKEKIDKIDFLKVDCEGAEYGIFEKDESFLKIVDKIIMETHPFEGKSVFTILDTLKKYGFKIHNEDEVISDKELNMVYASKES